MAASGYESYGKKVLRFKKKAAVPKLWDSSLVTKKKLP